MKVRSPKRIHGKHKTQRKVLNNATEAELATYGALDDDLDILMYKGMLQMADEAALPLTQAVFNGVRCTTVLSFVKLATWSSRYINGLQQFLPTTPSILTWLIM
jgi:hypothetical protein